MLLVQRSYVFVPCPVHLALRPTPKLACDTGRGSQFRVSYSANSVIYMLNITITQTKHGCLKTPLWGLGVQSCNNIFHSPEIFFFSHCHDVAHKSWYFNACCKVIIYMVLECILILTVYYCAVLFISV